MKKIAINLELTNDKSTFAFGEHLGQLSRPQTVIYLNGELGTGKTTFARGFLKGRGYFGKIKSPTYTLVESYSCSSLTVYHLDLYRLKQAEELEFLGIRDYVANDGILLIEWPELGKGFIPEPSLKLQFDFHDEARKVTLAAANLLGQEIMDDFEPRSSYRVMSK